jgi:hypothetical protein
MNMFVIVTGRHFSHVKSGRTGMHKPTKRQVG